MQITKALGLKEPILITLIGGGGKTTTLFKLGEELVSEGNPVILTTTTAMFMPSASQYDISIITESVEEAKEQIKDNLEKKRILLGKKVTPEDKIKGFTPEEMDEIYKENKNRYFLVEGDGSNGRSLKIPDAHEPQVPSESSITIILIGADILGKEINSENVHRHHLLNGIIQKCGKIVDKNLILDLIFHPLGITKGIPQNSKKIILFNKTRSSRKFEELRNLSKEILIRAKEKIKDMEGNFHIPTTIDTIFLGEVQEEDPILEVQGER